MKPSRRKTLFRLTGALAVLLGLWLAWEILAWPDVGELARTNPASTAFIDRYRRQQIRAGQPDRVMQSWVAYDAISPKLKRAVLVAEDINFFSHNGFDSAEIRQAVREALKQQSAPRGASTLSQQLSRNLWLSPSRNPLRKLKEALLTYQLERELSKERIFELYLNVAEFGPGIYGAEAAARHYFGRSARRINERQAARLAASLPSPSRLNPQRIDADHWRVRLIRERMRKATFLERHL